MNICKEDISDDDKMNVVALNMEVHFATITLGGKHKKKKRENVASGTIDCVSNLQNKHKQNIELVRREEIEKYIEIDRELTPLTNLDGLAKELLHGQGGQQPLETLENPEKPWKKNYPWKNP